MSQLTTAIRGVMGGHNLVAVSTEVKDLVCDELAAMDPAAEIKRTEYFNHSYLPDIVMTWSDFSTREVFTRFVNDRRQLEQDLSRIGQDGPVLFDLSTAIGETGEPVALGGLDVPLEIAPTVLLTDTEATEPVRPGSAKNLVEHLVAANILRAGRGRLDLDTARDAVELSRAGFDGAVKAEADPVRAAVEATRRIFGLDLERRVERSLQLVWSATGGDPELFPITLPDDMSLNPDDASDFLRFVLSDQQPIENDTFWTRLSDRVDFDTLVAVGDNDGSDNLHRLMGHLAAKLKLSHAALDNIPRPLLPVPFAWGLVDGFLRLSGPGWACRFTPQGNRFSQRRDVGRPVQLKDADTRAQGLIIEEVEIEDASRTLQVRRKPTTPAAYRQASLTTLTSGISAALVRQLVVQLGGDALKVEFDRMLVWSEKNPTVLQLAMAAVRFLAAPPEDELAELSDFLSATT